MSKKRLGRRKGWRKDGNHTPEYYGVTKSNKTNLSRSSSLKKSATYMAIELHIKALASEDICAIKSTKFILDSVLNAGEQA